jgi:hypothetical protein
MGNEREEHDNTEDESTIVKPLLIEISEDRIAEAREKRAENDKKRVECAKERRDE